MKQLDDFDKNLKLNKEIEEPIINKSNYKCDDQLEDQNKNKDKKHLNENINMDQTGFYMNDKLSASAFFKKVIIH